MTGEKDRLLVLPGAPEGALDGCPGQIELYVEHLPGGWSSSNCEVDVDLACEAHGCWFSRHIDGRTVTADDFAEAERLHDEAAGTRRRL